VRAAAAGDDDRRGGVCRVLHPLPPVNRIDFLSKTHTVPMGGGSRSAAANREGCLCGQMRAAYTASMPSKSHVSVLVSAAWRCSFFCWS
jgi:hypothetical protein